MCIIGVLSDLICFLFISDRFPLSCHLSLQLAGSDSQHCVTEGVDNIHHFHPVTHLHSPLSWPPKYLLLKPPPNQLISHLYELKLWQRGTVASLQRLVPRYINILESSKYLIFSDSRHQNFTRAVTRWLVVQRQCEDLSDIEIVGLQRRWLTTKD